MSYVPLVHSQNLFESNDTPSLSSPFNLLIGSVYLYVFMTIIWLGLKEMMLFNLSIAFVTMSYLCLKYFYFWMLLCIVSIEIHDLSNPVSVTFFCGDFCHQISHLLRCSKTSWVEFFVLSRNNVVIPPLKPVVGNTFRASFS